MRPYRGFSERVRELEGTKMVLIVGNNWFEEIFPLEPTEKREIHYGNLRCFALKYVI